MNKIEQLYKYLPNKVIDWPLIKAELLKPFVKSLENTNQEPKWHNEGNVLIHTMMVCDKLINLEEYKKLEKHDKLIVFLGALFHDIGKTVCTKYDNDEITSPNHGVVGSIILREYLWKDLGLAGTKEYQMFREAICFLVRYHASPVHEYKDLEKKVIKLSLNNKLTKYYNLNLLIILAKADILGRISLVPSNHLENLTLFKEQAIQLDCLNKAFKFTDSYTKYRYVNYDDVWPYEKLFNPNWGEIILVCGLPGSGKDTYIKNNYFHLPMISLDDIREEYGIDPKEEQGIVYNIAKERSKELLRNKKEFIFNATNLTNLVRKKLLNLFHSYQANVKIIFIETNLEENLIRNRNRKKVVPEKIIYKLLSNINIPEEIEAEEIEWVCL